MDLLMRFDSHVSSQQEVASPPIHQPTSLLHSSSSSSHTGFPIIAVAIIGILATALLLVGYYIFVIKCCLNWHRIDLLRRLSLSRSRRRRVQDLSAVHSPVPENRGLDELVIRSIPIFKFRKNEKESSSQELKSHECAVCLNEFQEEEKLRAIPNCAHVFHIDCIDIWLQNNSNCPLCRTSVSATRPVFGVERILDPTPFPQDLNPSSHSFTGRDEDYVVIEVVAALETGHLLSTSRSQRKSTPEVKKVNRVWSMGDECIDIREKDWQFVVKPIRRSFSMDSAADRQLHLAVQDIQEQSRIASHYLSVQSEDYSSGSSSSRLKRSFFSFGQARGSRTSVQPVSSMEP